MKKGWKQENKVRKNNQNGHNVRALIVHQSNTAASDDH